MKNKHLRNPYHKKLEEAELTPAQLNKGHILTMQAMYHKQAKHVEQEMKGVFLNNIFKSLNLTKYN